MPPGASRSYPPPTPGSQPQPAWEQHLPPPMAPLLLPGSTLLQPAHPMTPRVTPADHGPIAPGLGNIPVPVWSGGRSALPHQSQAFGRPQAPLNGNASRALMGSALCPAPLCIASPVGDSGVAAPAIAAAQAGKGGLAPGLPPQAAPPAAQMAFILPQRALGRGHMAPLGQAACMPPSTRALRRTPLTIRASIRTSDAGSASSPWPAATCPRAPMRKLSPAFSCK